MSVRFECFTRFFLIILISLQVFQRVPQSGMAIFLANSSRMFWEMSEIPGAFERRVSTQPTAVVEENMKGILVAHAVIRHSAKDDRLRSIRDEIRNASGHSHQDMSSQIVTVQDSSRELENFVHPSYLAANSQTDIKKLLEETRCSDYI